jgi:hypothetical protein
VAKKATKKATATWPPPRDEPVEWRIVPPEEVVREISPAMIDALRRSLDHLIRVAPVFVLTFEKHEAISPDIPAWTARVCLAETGFCGLGGCADMLWDAIDAVVHAVYVIRGMEPDTMPDPRWRPFYYAVGTLDRSLWSIALRVGYRRGDAGYCGRKVQTWYFDRERASKAFKGQMLWIRPDELAGLKIARDLLAIDPETVPVTTNTPGQPPREGLDLLRHMAQSGVPRKVMASRTGYSESQISRLLTGKSKQPRRKITTKP